MAYTETTTTGYGTRLKNSLGGIGAGFVMFLGATCLLWWNEGRAVKTAKMLDEVQGNYVEMEDIKNVDPDLDGCLVHATGEATTTDTVCDDIFGVKDLAIGMTRTVEYYQWVEKSKSTTRDKLGGGEETVTTYTYERKWVSKPVESDEFHDPQYQNANKQLVTVEDQRFNATAVAFGAYELSENQIAALPCRTNVSVSIPDETLRALDRDITTTYVRLNGRNPVRPEIVEPAATAPVVNDTAAAEQQQKREAYRALLVHQQTNSIYVGTNPGVPEIGDVRITYKKAKPGKVSLIAKVNGNSFGKYVAKNGKTLSVIRTGTHSADEMFQAEKDSNSALTWGLRILGLVLVIMGLRSVFGILETLLKVVPFLANIMGFGISMICGIVGFVWSVLVIAVAWIVYRPVLGITLLVIAALVIFAFSSKGKALIKQQIAARTQAQPKE